MRLQTYIQRVMVKAVIFRKDEAPPFPWIISPYKKECILGQAVWVQSKHRANMPIRTRIDASGVQATTRLSLQPLQPGPLEETVQPAVQEGRAPPWPLELRGPLADPPEWCPVMVLTSVCLGSCAEGLCLEHQPQRRADGVLRGRKRSRAGE